MIERSLTFVAVAAAVLGAPWAARAQTDPMAAARQAAANQLGVMEYCQDQGYADGDAVSAQRTALAQLTQGDTATAAAAEALGRKGTLSANGQNLTLASLASTHNTTVGAMCGQMASAAKQAAAMRSSMPAMPAMPNGMPSMPGGMPAMPNGVPGGMPGMPAAPSR